MVSIKLEYLPSHIPYIFSINGVLTKSFNPNIWYPPYILELWPHFGKSFQHRTVHGDKVQRAHGPTGPTAAAPPRGPRRHQSGFTAQTNPLHRRGKCAFVQF